MHDTHIKVYISQGYLRAWRILSIIFWFYIMFNFLISIYYNWSIHRLIWCLEIINSIFWNFMVDQDKYVATTFISILDHSFCFKKVFLKFYLLELFIKNVDFLRSYLSHLWTAEYYQLAHISHVQAASHWYVWPPFSLLNKKSMAEWKYRISQPRIQISASRRTVF